MFTALEIIFFHEVHVETKKFKTEKAPSKKIPSYQTERPEKSVIAKINTPNPENLSEVFQQREIENCWWRR